MLEMMRDMNPFSDILTTVVAFTRLDCELSEKHVKNSKLIVMCGEVKSRFSLKMVSDIWLAWGSNKICI